MDEEQHSNKGQGCDDEFPGVDIADDSLWAKQNYQDNQPSKSLLQKWQDLSIDRQIESGVALVGLVIAGVLASTAIYQLNAMREQTTSMKDQLAEMKAGSAETGKLIAATEKIAEATSTGVAQSKAALEATVEASRLGQRAWVTAQNIQFEKLNNKGGDQVIGWQFRAIWENIGATPTRGARNHVSWLPIQNALPSDFRFPDLGASENIPLVLGPKASLGSGLMNVDTNTIKAVQERKIHLYFWGWMSYRDIFENTRLHITKFCRELTEIHGDPVRAGGPVRAIFTNCPYHNCTDEECDRKNKNQPSP